MFTYICYVLSEILGLEPSVGTPVPANLSMRLRTLMNKQIVSFHTKLPSGWGSGSRYGKFVYEKFFSFEKMTLRNWGRRFAKAYNKLKWGLIICSSVQASGEGGWAGQQAGTLAPMNKIGKYDTPWNTSGLPSLPGTRRACPWF